MPETLVVNASPVIFLHRVNGLGFLGKLAAKVVVTTSVAAEVRAGRDGNVVFDDLTHTDRVELSSDVEVPVQVAAWDLGGGETQVLSYCLQSVGAIAILDDRAARRCAASLSIACIGTLGLVVIAKRRQWIPAARPIVELLLARGMFIGPDVLREVLAQAGE